MIRIPRLPWDEFFMLHAHLAATRSTCDHGPELLFDPGRKGVGSVFVRENRVVAGGYNGSPPGEPHCSDPLKCFDCGEEFEPRAALEDGDPCPECGPDHPVRGGHLLIDGHCVRTLHAEENALLQCAIDGVSARGATVYTTASTCYDCAKRLVRAGVARVCFGVAYGSRYGLSGDALDLLRRAEIRVELVDVSEFVRGPLFTF